MNLILCGMMGAGKTTVALALAKRTGRAYLDTDEQIVQNHGNISDIFTRFGEKYLPKKPRYFKTKSGAQDAHEAIRPTNISLAPDDIKDSLSTEQYKLYKLIWERFIASLMYRHERLRYLVMLSSLRYLREKFQDELKLPFRPFLSKSLRLLR